MCWAVSLPRMVRGVVTCHEMIIRLRRLVAVEGTVGLGALAGMVRPLWVLGVETAVQVPVRGRLRGGGDASGLTGPTMQGRSAREDGTGGLSEAQRAAIVAAVLELPPMTCEQVDSVCEVIVTARTRWRREDDRRGHATGTGYGPT